MRLTALEPHWVNMPQAADNVRFIIGVSFLCPHCVHDPCPTCGHVRGKRLAVNFWPPIDPDNWGAKMSSEYPHEKFHRRVNGDTFETLTIEPSIGFDPHWHGRITDGELIP